MFTSRIVPEFTQAQVGSGTFTLALPTSGIRLIHEIIVVGDDEREFDITEGGIKIIEAQLAAGVPYHSAPTLPWRQTGDLVFDPDSTMTIWVNVIASLHRR